MASEIRVNKQTNRVGLGTVTYTDTGIIVSGIVTANSFEGDGSSLTGIAADKIFEGNTIVETIDTGSNGHIKFTTEGSEVARITASGHLGIGVNPSNDTGYLLQLDSGAAQTFMTFANSGSGNGALNGLVIGNDTSRAYITQREDQDIHIATNNNVRLVIQNDGHLRPNTDSTIDLGLTGTRFRNVYADTYYGDGANLTNLPAGAPVGGASTNTVFFENDKAVAVNYQITSTKNAMSAGPISINAGIAVTVPSGCSWTIV